jgi:hypothetical protein
MKKLASGMLIKSGNSSVHLRAKGGRSTNFSSYLAGVKIKYTLHTLIYLYSLFQQYIEGRSLYNVVKVSTHCIVPTEGCAVCK